MTLADIRSIDPAAARAYVLRIERGMKREAVARKLGVSGPTVRDRVLRAERLMRGGRQRGCANLTPEETSRLEDRLTRLGRCVCGLLLPCSCGTGDPLATSRPGEGAVYPEGGW